MIIRRIRQTLQGVYEITPDVESAFFLRARYLQSVSENRLVAVPDGLAEGDSLFIQPGDLQAGMDGVFSLEESSDILHAALVYSIENAAMTYLAGAEQCRASLVSKLTKKGLEKNDVDMALDYLEETGYLDDYRFACAWLRTRYINHAEGRTKLSRELLSRGIAGQTVKKALDDFFQNHTQKDICRRAVKKYFRTHKSAASDKIYSSLIRQGFTYSQIKEALSASDS